MGIYIYIYIYILLFEQGTMLNGQGVRLVQSDPALLGACLGAWMTRHPPSLTTMHVSMGGGWTDGWTNGRIGQTDR
jgi:hypothetical protein